MNIAQILLFQREPHEAMAFQAITLHFVIIDKIICYQVFTIHAHYPHYFAILVVYWVL